MKISALVLSGATLFSGALIWPLHAETAAPVAASLEERMSRLEAKLDAVERENQTLRTRLGEVASSVPAPAAKYPEIRLNVLGSVEYAFNNQKDSPNSVTVGDLDFVTTARLNDQASATMDFVVASDQGGFMYEIERMFVSYKFNDSFNLDIGRFHTAMGWYNNFYHNGTYFQTARDRPELFNFEDNSGILPVHSTGLSLNGEIPSGSLGLSYSAEISNGRSYIDDEKHALQIEDDNNFKAFNVQLRAKPEGLSNWQFGVGAYHDTLTPVLDPDRAPGLTTRVDQLIFTGFAIYKSPLVEWFTETALVGDKATDGNRHWTLAGYTQLSKKFNQLRPYVRLQWREAATHDEVLSLIEENTSYLGSQVGVRYDFAPMLALKLEYEHVRNRGEASSDEFSTQLAFRF